MSRMLAALLLVSLASSQDRAEITGRIETWYRVTQGKKPAGYLHEILQRSRVAWRYDYWLEAELDLQERDKVHAEDLHVVAGLDDGFTPVELSVEAVSDDVPAQISMFATREDRRFEVRPAGKGDAVAWTSGVTDDFHALPTISLFALRQNDALAKPGRVTLRALDPRGAAKDGVEVVIEVGEPVRREIRGKTVPLIPVTFLKPFPTPSRATELRDALIDRYGRVVEATLAGGAKIAMVDGEKEALADSSPIRRLGRRDPFDKLAALRNAALERFRAGRGEIDPPTPRPTADTLMSDLSAVSKLPEEIRAQKASGDPDEARKTYRLMLVRLKAIRELAQRIRPQLLPQIEQAREDAELAWDGAAQLEQEARARYVQLAGLLDRLEVEAIEQTRKDLESMRDRLEVEGRPERMKIAEWIADAGGMLVQARTRRDLASARLDITAITLADVSTTETIDFRTTWFGVTIGEVQEIRFIRPFAEVDVNGRIYRTGDMVQGTQIRIDKIGRQSVTFALRDQTREVGLRR